jgi:hypothetical protein
LSDMIQRLEGSHYVHVEANDLPVSIISLVQTSSCGVEEVLQPEDVVESIQMSDTCGHSPSRHSDTPIWYLGIKSIHLH